jgi:hypothetical protein
MTGSTAETSVTFQRCLVIREIQGELPNFLPICGSLMECISQSKNVSTIKLCMRTLVCVCVGGVHIHMYTHKMYL